MGNPSNTPSLSVKQDQRDAVSNQGGTQKMGWSAGNEQTTRGRGYAKAGGQEENAKEIRMHLLRQGRKGENVFARFSAGKLEQAQACAVWAGSGMRWL